MIVARAATHVVFAFVGAVILKRKPKIIESVASATVFALLISILHASCEIAVVAPFYFGNLMSKGIC